MQSLLTRAELWPVVSGTYQEPDPDHVAWALMDAKARSEIIFCCGDLKKQPVRNLDTAKKIWDTLKATYDHVDMATQVNSQRRLMLLQMKENDSVSDFVDRWQAHLDDTVSA